MPSARDHAAVKARAWALRQRGRTQETIAREIGVDQSTVSRWLAGNERREMKLLRATAPSKKVFQEALLNLIVEESITAWEASKQPRTRVRETTEPGEPLLDDAGRPVLDARGQAVHKPGAKTVDVIQQTGDAAYLDRAFAALAALRKLWGLDVAEQRNDLGPSTIAERLKALKERAARFEAARKADGHDNDNDNEAKPDGPHGQADG